MHSPEVLVSILIGIGLAAAAGFRVFVPLLVLSLAGRSGYVELAPGFAWVTSNPALVVLSAATAAEILAYFVPGADHILDILATPAAVVAGTLATAALIGDVPPMLSWSIAAIGGGGTAGLVQSGTVLVRGVSGLTTLGLANPLVALVELAGSLVMSAVAILAPLVGILVVGTLFLIIVLGTLRRRRHS